MTYSEIPSPFRLKKLRAKAQKANAMATSLQLPNEVWASIFAPLPLKTLGICRNVCRAWNSILTDTAFISVHLDHAKAKPSSSSSCRMRCKFMVADKGTVYTKWREEVDDEKANNWNNKFYRVPPGFPLSRQHSGIEGVNAIGVSGGIYCVQVTDSYHENVMVWNPSIRKCMLLQRRPRSVGNVIQT